MTYLLDANIFIQAKNLHYGFDFCPAFWDWLTQQNHSERVASIEKVADELYAGDDELTAWAKERGADFFVKPDNAVVDALVKVGNWAQGADYYPAAIATFLQVADYWLVAHALAHNCTVVTHEVPAHSMHKIKIPNACISMGLRCISPYEMLRRERARFILAPNGRAA